MAKKQAYDSKFFDSFGAECLAGEAKSSFGFLIGTKLQDGRRDVIFAAATPPMPETEGKASTATAVLQSSSNGMPYAQWASSHAVQLKGLLAGGLEPCGVFCVDTDSPALAAQLVPVLKGISDPLVLLIESGAKKWGFKQHDSKGSKPALRPAQMKGASYDQSLLLWCAVPVDLVIPQNKDIASNTCKEVMASLASATTSFVSEGGALSLVTGQEAEALSKIVQAGSRELNVKFLNQGSALRAKVSACSEPFTRVRCLILATTLVLHRDWEIREVMNMIQENISSSLEARLSLALEEAGDEPVASLQLPWRALCRPSNSNLPIWCGDLCMPDEQIDSACERLTVMLGLPSSEALEIAPAHLNESEVLKKYAGTYDSSAASNGGTGGSDGKNGNMLMILSSVTVALAMIIIAVILGLVRK
eukprot:gnl/MRDRNA2_/MRDRNA2_62895_c0_seq1.p1 gnl/MRDRNA2_/MRDRNA2_62895_c0~~gnl/MRDRNA2_/MRDRNA2_62895_c0_seq1.p1  ORF type:complete len:419 (-),score=99.45 gnl/MRDRNA2_/MRDRNA2_62895_c0_seq1:9-1265(-)